MRNKFQFKKSLYFWKWNNLCFDEKSKCLELQMVKMKGNTTSDLKVHFWWYLVALSLFFINSAIKISIECAKKTKTNNYNQNNSCFATLNQLCLELARIIELYLGFGLVKFRVQIVTNRYGVSFIICRFQPQKWPRCHDKHFAIWAGFVVGECQTTEKEKLVNAVPATKLNLKRMEFFYTKLLQQICIMTN